ncbi:MAG: hypothetical protein IT204_16925 [Fimbriimonadaceae bacterium]|nr:hypothetical protein [Fimbriimonadaceae bacterium]
MLRRIGLLLLLLLAGGACRADDAQAIEKLVAGDLALQARGLERAFYEWNLGYGLANSNYLSIEALARLATNSPLGSRERASTVGLLLGWFEATPPRWLSDEGRRIVAQSIVQPPDGLPRAQLEQLGSRAVSFTSLPTGLGFVGKRHYWMVQLSRLPPPVDQYRLDDELVQRDPDCLPVDRLELGGGRWSVVEPREAAKRLPLPEQRKWQFDRCLVGYTYEPLVTYLDDLGRRVSSPITPWYDWQQAVWQQRFRLFYPSPELAGVDLQATAEQLLDTLLRVHWLAVETLGREPWDGQRADQVVDVWLTPNLATEALHAGGERWLNNLYFYQAAAPRQPVEWVRETAHEFGHLVLPRIGRYTNTQQFEVWLDGPLGERLLLGALARQLAGAAPEELGAWMAELKKTDFFTAYRRTDWEPLRQVALQAGPSSSLRTTLDDRGAAWLIGWLLDVAERHPPRFLYDLWRPLASNAQYSAEALQTAYRNRLKELRSFRLNAAPPPRNIGDPPAVANDEGLLLGETQQVEYQVWLEPGDWQLRLLTTRPGALTVQHGPFAARLVETSPDATATPAVTIPSEGGWTAVRIGGFSNEPAPLVALDWSRLRR